MLGCNFFYWQTHNISGITWPYCYCGMVSWIDVCIQYKSKDICKVNVIPSISLFYYGVWFSSKKLRGLVFRISRLHSAPKKLQQALTAIIAFFSTEEVCRSYFIWSRLASSCTILELAGWLSLLTFCRFMAGRLRRRIAWDHLCCNWVYFHRIVVHV